MAAPPAEASKRARIAFNPAAATFTPGSHTHSRTAHSTGGSAAFAPGSSIPSTAAVGSGLAPAPVARRRGSSNANNAQHAAPKAVVAAVTDVSVHTHTDGDTHASAHTGAGVRRGRGAGSDAGSRSRPAGSFVHAAARVDGWTPGIASGTGMPPTPLTSLAEDGRAKDEWVHTHVHPLKPRGPTVFILRGISGAGKSSVAAALTEGVPPELVRTCSADHFFLLKGGATYDTRTHTYTGGKYDFDASLLSSAHEFCRNAFIRALSERAPVIIVDNTNTTLREYEAYKALTREYNDRVRAGAAEPPIPLPSAAPGVANSGSTAAASDDTAGSRLPGPVYRVHVIEITCPDQATFELFASRNTHSVSRDAMLRQWQRFEHDDTASVIPAFVPPSVQPWLDQQRAALALTAAAFLYAPVADPAAAGSWLSAVAPSAALPTWPLGLPASLPAAPGAVRADERVPRTPLEKALLKLGKDTVFVGIFLFAESRQTLGANFPPKFGVSHIDHLTVVHKPKQNCMTAEIVNCVGLAVTLRVAAESVRAGVQAVEVEWADLPRASTARATSSSRAAAASLAAASDESDSDGESAPDAEERDETPAVDASEELAAEPAAIAGAASAPSAETPKKPATTPAKGVSYAAAVRANMPQSADDSRTGSNNERVRTAITTSLRASNGLSRNRYPHVTISTRAGVAPAASNDMLVKAHAAGEAPTSTPGARTITISGRLGFVVNAGPTRPPKYLLKRDMLLKWLHLNPDALEA